VEVGGCQWPKKWPKIPSRAVASKQSKGYLRPSYDLLLWFWWLAMVVEVLDGAGGGGGWLRNGRKITRQIARKLRAAGWGKAA